MSTIELKTQLYGLIANTNNVSLLKQIYTFLSKADSKKQANWWDTISEEEKAAIEEGIAQADRGEVVPLSKVIAQGRAIYKK